MLKLNKRTVKVRQASFDIGKWLIEKQKKENITDIELIQILNSHIALIIKDMLREERHGNSDKAADEE